MEKNKSLFWLACILSTVVAIYWSYISVVQMPSIVFKAFFFINIAALITNVICLIIDKKKSKNN